MELSLSGRTVLITGASSGFGAHFARLFVAEGARVVIGRAGGQAGCAGG
jgi:NAD(P)-dependent dehydrogenase (short-subunit alcohol dehydrogenase family)